MKSILQLNINQYTCLLFLFMVFNAIITMSQNKDSAKDKDTHLEISPNPAKANSSFKLRLKKRDVITLDVYDSKGAFVERVYDNETLEKGNHSKPFKRKNKSSETYTCMLVSANSGKHTDYLIFDELIVDTVTDISVSATKNGLLVGPNPANNFIDISSPGRPVTRVLVHDMIGNTVINEQVDFSENYKVDLMSLHPGIYFLTLGRREETDVIRIVKTE